jgi:hypothetical protein
LRRGAAENTQLVVVRREDDVPRDAVIRITRFSANWQIALPADAEEIIIR